MLFPKMTGLAVVALLAFAYAQSPSPTDDSNFSAQTGEFRYMPGYVAQQPLLPYGMVSGRAAIIRKAKSATTTATINVYIEVLPSDFNTLVPTGEFKALLHSRPCAQGGGARYQDPLICDSDGGFTEGCTPAEVAAHSGPEPLELEVTGTVETITSNGQTFNRVVGTYDWGNHIPEQLDGQTIESLSMLLYDPRIDFPMVCADLEVDRQMDGIVFFVNQALVQNVPSVSDATLTRTEIGTTTVNLAVANLRSNAVYPASVRALPCLADSQGGGGDHPFYMRDINCVGNEGSTGCEVTNPSNIIDLTLNVGGSTSSASSTVTLDHAARADAMSIVLLDCLDGGGNPDPSGTCAGGTPTLMCIDLMDEIPQVASSSSTAPFGVISTTLDVPVVTETTVTATTVTTVTTVTGTTETDTTVTATTITATTITDTTVTDTSITVTKTHTGTATTITDTSTVTSVTTTITTTTTTKVFLSFPVGLDFEGDLTDSLESYIISLVKDALQTSSLGFSSGEVEFFSYSVVIDPDGSGSGSASGNLQYLNIIIGAQTQAQQVLILSAAEELAQLIQSSFVEPVEETTIQARVPEEEEPVKNNPCGSVRYQMDPDMDSSTTVDVSVKGKNGKKSKSSKSQSASVKSKKSKSSKGGYQVVQLDFEDLGDLGYCCLDPNGPGMSVVGFYPKLARAGVPRSTLVALIAGITGSVMVSLAVVSYMRRRYHQEAEIRMVHNSYALPSSHYE
eukprot:m.9573 g.9573  ORF g.9573 m.9573 type:complete len:735 (-) comp4088_c0_seq1:1377-3581(-)